MNYLRALLIVQVVNVKSKISLNEEKKKNLLFLVITRKVKLSAHEECGKLAKA